MIMSMLKVKTGTLQDGKTNLMKMKLMIISQITMWTETSGAAGPQEFSSPMAVFLVQLKATIQKRSIGSELSTGKGNMMSRPDGEGGAEEVQPLPKMVVMETLSNLNSSAEHVR